MILLGKSSKLLEQLFFRTALKEIIFFFGLFMEKLCTVIHLHLFGKQKALYEILLIRSIYEKFLRKLLFYKIRTFPKKP